MHFFANEHKSASSCFVDFLSFSDERISRGPSYQDFLISMSKSFYFRLRRVTDRGFA